MRQELQIVIAGQMAEGQTMPVWPYTQEKIVIDPKLIPDSVYQTASRALNTCIRRALSTPEGRASFEAWKRERTVSK